MFARQSRHPTRDAALIAAALVTGASPALSQQMADNATRFPSSGETGVSATDCAVFQHFLAQEARDFPGKLSATFLRSVIRFTKAGCKAQDADGEIQIISETDQDAVSFRTARGRMGKIDITGLSGVKGCHRPPDGVCPAQTGAARTKRPAAGS